MGGAYSTLSSLEIDPMPDLTIARLGTPLNRYKNRSLKFDPRKTVSLIAYPAVTGAEGTLYQSREAQATLLWPESSPANARSVLRRNLSVLNRQIEGDCADSSSIYVSDTACSYWTIWKVLQALIVQGRKTVMELRAIAKLIRRMGTSIHRSTLLITSRDRPMMLGGWSNARRPCKPCSWMD